jgi:hypothetical protein
VVEEAPVLDRDGRVADDLRDLAAGDGVRRTSELMKPRRSPLAA